MRSRMIAQKKEKLELGAWLSMFLPFFILRYSDHMGAPEEVWMDATQ